MKSLPRLLVSVGISLAHGVHQGTTALSQAFGPRSTIQVSRPLLQWQVWSRKGVVTRAQMLIDFKPVDAKYDVAERSILYTPREPLSAGLHHVECTATFDGETSFSKSWDFTVRPNALVYLPRPDAVQDKLLDLVNLRRRQLGLVKVKVDDRLDAAAAAHVFYLCKNDQTGHDEQPGTPGFVGPTGAARCESFGWSAGVWEGVTVGEGLEEHAIRDLFDAPYHRIPFMQPGAVSFGGDFNDARTTVLFSKTLKSGIIVSPSDGEEGVPTKWENHENPSPLRDHTNKTVAGYPIVIAGFSPEKKALRVNSASLTSADGQVVPIWLQTSESDTDLTNAAIMIPQDPLRPGTAYEASAEVVYDGKKVTRTWSFVTGG